MITLYKGDDTQGQLGKKCIIKFHCDDAVDMTNVTVRFNLLNIVTKDFQNVHDGDELEVFVSHVDSRKLPLGIVYGKLWGEDSSGKIRTFANRIPFKLTTDLRCVYGSDGLDSVDVHVYSSVDWDSIANKPTLFPSKVSMVEGLEEALKQAGKVKTVNGQSPDENGNIEIEIPSCKVTSVNNKTGDVELTAQDIPYGGEGASNVETAIEQNAQAIGEKVSKDEVLPNPIDEFHSAWIGKVGGKSFFIPVENFNMRFCDKREKTDLQVYKHDGYTEWELGAKEIAWGWYIEDDGDESVVYDADGERIGAVITDESNPKEGLVRDSTGSVLCKVNRAEYTIEDEGVKLLTSKDVGNGVIAPIKIGGKDVLNSDLNPQIVYFAGKYAELDASTSQKDFILNVSYKTNDSGEEVIEKFNLYRPLTEVYSRDIYISEFNDGYFSENISFVVSRSKPYWWTGSPKTSNTISIECRIDNNLLYVYGYYNEESYSLMLYGGAITAYKKEDLDKLPIGDPIAFLGTEEARSAIIDAVRGQIAVSWSNVKDAPIIPTVVPPSSSATTGQAADAKDVFDKLAGKLDANTNNLTVVTQSNGAGYIALSINDEGIAEIVYEDGKGDGWRLKLPNTGEDGVIARTSELSGITSQDITDFLHYRGEWKYEEGISLTKGDVYILKISVDTPQFLRAKTTTISTGDASELDESFDKIYDANEGKTGLERLIDLFGESNSQLAKTIKAKTAYEVVDDITNRSVKRVTISTADAMTVVLPKPTASSGVIDFEVWFDATAYTGETYPSIGYKYDATTDADVITKDGENLAYGDGAVTIVHFTSVNGSAYTAVAASFK